MSELLLEREVPYSDPDIDKSNLTPIELEIIEHKIQEKILANAAIDLAYGEFNEHLKANPEALVGMLNHLRDASDLTHHPDDVDANMIHAIHRVIVATNNGRSIGVGSRTDELFAQIYKDEEHTRIRTQYHQTLQAISETNRKEEEEKLSHLEERREALSVRRALVALGVIATTNLEERSQEAKENIAKAV